MPNYKSYSSETEISEIISVQDQDPEKMITIGGKKYIVYYVKEGDTWYGLARKFKMTYAELRMANKHSDDKLIIGKEVLVPVEKLKANDPYYDKNYMDDKVEKKGGEPIYHTVKKSQTLYSISMLYNISVDEIKEWNQLKSNEINVGQKLLVKKDQKKIESKVPKQEVYSPKENAVKNSRVEKYEKQSTTEVISPSNTGKIVFANSRRKIEEEGYATWISSDESGDEKYYALHRTAPIGTIIKVINVYNSSQIYVKVTGQLPDTFENDGIIINISKSSADKLEVKDKKFRVELLYGLDKE